MLLNLIESPWWMRINITDGYWCGEPDDTNHLQGTRCSPIRYIGRYFFYSWGVVVDRFRMWFVYQQTSAVMFGKPFIYIYIYTSFILDYFPIIYITYSIWSICSMTKSVLFLHKFHGLHHHHGHGHRERALMPWRLTRGIRTAAVKHYLRQMAETWWSGTGDICWVDDLGDVPFNYC